MKPRTTIQTLIGSILLIASILILGYMATNIDASGDEISLSVILPGIAVVCFLIAGLVLVLSAEFKRKKAKRDAEDWDANRLDELEEIEFSARKASAPEPEYMPPWEGRKIDYVVIAHSSDRMKAGSAIGAGQSVPRCLGRWASSPPGLPSAKGILI